MDLCKQLVFDSSIRPSKAVFFYKTKDSEFEPLEAETIKIQGTSSGYDKCYDKDGELKNTQPQDLGYGNPHTLDSCFVPPLVNQIFCQFSLNVLGNSLGPSRCESRRWSYLFTELSQRYFNAGGYLELGKRYAKNILMGNWLWKNKKSGVQITVYIGNATFSVNDISVLDWIAKWSLSDEETLNSLASLLADGLSGKQILDAEITAMIPTSFCQEIYPSQVFTESKSGNNDKSKIYMKAVLPNKKQAVCFTKDKVNAAIQRIDDWWENNASPIRVGEYGADKENCLGRRHPLERQDFYSLLQRAAVYERQLRQIKPEGSHLISNEIHYLMAVLCKGGMFQKGKS